jgi:hypothetical protein
MGLGGRFADVLVAMVDAMLGGRTGELVRVLRPVTALPPPFPVRVSDDVPSFVAMLCIVGVGLIGRRTVEAGLEFRD